MEDVQVVSNSKGQFLLVLGDRGIELSRQEAELLFVNLGHVLQEDDLSEE